MKLTTCKQIESIKAYEPGKPIKELERELGIKNAVKLASNENPLGCSPKVREAVIKNLGTMHRYPDPRGYDLKKAISEKYIIKTENIIIGNGSDEIISMLANAFLKTDEEALMPLPSFLMYEICVKIAKGNPVMVPLKNFQTDFDRILEMVNTKTRMIFLTNPFNPTGNVFTEDEFYSFIVKVPENILVIVDEAYIEFVQECSSYDSLKKPLEDKRIVTLRTFSKAYGLAGFRLGYGVMDVEAAKILNKIRPPFNVNSLAQAAGIAALKDTEFFEKSINLTLNELSFIKTELKALGIDFLPTCSNFIMIDVKKDSKVVFNDLLKNGVIVKSMKSYGFDSWIRMNAGTHNENVLFIEALKKVL